MSHNGKPGTDRDPGITLAMALPQRVADGASTIIVEAGAQTPAPGPQPGAATGTPRYAIVGHAGSGGMATVHVARDLELLRTVALKQLAAGIAGTGSARLRFLREVQITAQLDHPQIVPVYGLEVAPDGAPAYAMKFVDGRTLEDLLEEARTAHEEGRHDESCALPMRIEHFLKVCDAVDFAHDKGVIHRDLKPANVMIGPHNEIYVMDWGICRLFDRDDRDEIEDAAVAPVTDASGGHATEYGAVIGTPRYMSPEQAQGRSDELGPLSDQCALGLILQELVTLSPSIGGGDAQQMLVAAAHGRREPLLEYGTRRAVPAPLRAIVERATALEPRRRYASVRALADDLRRYLRGEAVQALPDTLWQKALRYVGRHRQQVLLAVVGLVAVAAIGFALLLQRHERELLAQQQREARVRTLVDALAGQGDRLQLRLMRLQGELDALATAATHLLRHGQPADALLYWSQDYRDPAARPPDFGPQPGFAQAVSLAYGVWSHPPQVAREAVLPEAQRLYNLLPYRNELFTEARSTLGDGSGASGVARFVIALESGLCVHYPGVASLAADHDSRNTVGYRNSIGHRGALWGAPYVDAESGTLLLPLSESLRTPDGAALGLASIDLSLDYIVHNLLGGSDAGDGITVLLDAEGRVLASEQVLTGGAGTDGALRLQPFPDPALVEALRDDDLGTLETEAFGDTATLAYDRIQPTGWILVTRMPNAQLYGAGGR
ncbi:MAG TPA: protein kinase [Xanthomonadaceae bacterium]|nr:protein kinase [Xanthomonadaceae bacterium]